VFSEPFMLIALAAGLVIGGLCAYLGNFILLKGMTFISIALAEIAALGVALGLALHVSPSLAAFAMTLAAVVFFWQRDRMWRATTEGVIGVLYVTSAALAIIIVSHNPMMQAHGVDLVSGNLLYCTPGDLVGVSAVGVAIGIPHMLFRRRFIFVSFDRETAKAQGLRSDAWDLLLMLSIGIWIAVCMRYAGVLFVFASLVVPPMVGLAVFRRVSLVLAVSVLVALCSVSLGVVVSYRLDLPTSPSIITAYALSYVGGLLWRGLRARVPG
jgi:ABC-type Mn2+/Zn2+ transport system permease subunit